MIVSHRHKFIFLKTRKTGGTSLEIGLSEHCGPDDIITEISPSDEETRKGLGFRGPQNHALSTGQVALIGGEGKRAHFFVNHDPAARILKGLGDGIWNSYYKFTIERNPFDKAISRYYWNTRNRAKPESISNFLSQCSSHLLSNWGIYTLEDRIAVDHVICYENLAEEIQRLARELRTGSITMPRAKGSHRRDRRPYQDVLSERDRELIERVCAREMTEFGYKW